MAVFLNTGTKKAMVDNHTPLKTTPIATTSNKTTQSNTANNTPKTTIGWNSPYGTLGAAYKANNAATTNTPKANATVNTPKKPTNLNAINTVVYSSGAEDAGTNFFTKKEEPTEPVTGGTGGGNVGGGGYAYYDYSADNMLGDLQSLYEQQQNALASQLQAQQAWYEAQLREQQIAKQQAAQNAYNSNIAALQAAYEKRLSGLDSNLASTKDTLASSYGNSKDALNANAEKALQEAYINRMMNEKSLRQQLNAQGLNGGASESAIASMLNNYGTSRNNINTATTDSLRSLEQNYNDNVAQAQQKYNDALSSAEANNMAYKMQLENDLQNGIVGSYNDLYSALASMDGTYANAMTNLIASQSAANADLQQSMYNTMVKNAMTPVKVSTTGNSATTDMVNKVKQRYNSGASVEQLLSELSDYSNEYIAQVFTKAGVQF